MQTWRLNPQVRWRRTRQGGAAFLPATAVSVELDEEAFTALRRLVEPHSARGLRAHFIAQFQRNFTVAELDIFLRELAAQGTLLAGEAATTEPAAPTWPTAYAPESVHLQLNNVCNLRCPSCYVGLHAEDADVLPFARIETLLDELAALGVFQLALGGGEALMSPKFVSVTRAARQRGIVPNVTTNGWLITDALLAEVADSLGELRMSLNDAVSVNQVLLTEKAALLRRRRMRFGFNLIVTRRNLARLPEWLTWACEQEAATINLIRPKPAPGNAGWYAANALTPADAARLGDMLAESEPLFSHTALTVDCAFSFLFHGQPAPALQARGVAGCAMGERFATIKWNGDVTPCSHLHGESFTAGNILHETFTEIWERSAVFAEVRRGLENVGGHCGNCGHNPFCRGCRAVMQQANGDWLAADQDCSVAAHG